VWIRSCYIATQSLAFGLLSSVICVFLFNFFFIDPKYTLMINDPNYYVSIVIFFVVVVIINTLSFRLQKQMIISTSNEKRINTLYEMSKALLNLHSIDEIANYEAQLLHKYFGRETVIILQMEKSIQRYGSLDLFPTETHEKELAWCTRHFSVCGFEEKAFPELTVKLFPFKIKSARQATGIIVVQRGAILYRDEYPSFDAFVGT
jgi:two-component system sensor histidine kinase KdpD